MKTETLTVWALVFCYAIELSQCLHYEWLIEMRSHILGALILGHQFLWTDIMAYTLGIALAAVGELKYRSKQTVYSSSS